MDDSSVTHYILLAAHLLVGFTLVYFAAKAFRKTKYPPMALLAVGFTLLVLGETVVEYGFGFLQESLLRLVEEGFEIAGFVVLIVAVKKS